MKKHIRIIGIVMMGNPVSHVLASKSAKAFLADRFSGTDYQMERITYSFKDGRYRAFMVSPSGIDGDFSIQNTMKAEFK